MAQTNTSLKTTERTHEGAPAKRIGPEERLRRAVSACLLWENEFYEEGVEIATRIHYLVGKVGPESAGEIALKARGELNLRHAPLMLAASMAYHYRNEPRVGNTIEAVIQRADELSEMLALVAKINGVGPDQVKQVLSAQVKRGVAAAFGKFDEYQLAKYNRDRAITLRDAMFLTHPKPKDAEQEALWKRLVDGQLRAPDTWEVGLSAGEDKRATFERLLREGKLGYMALLRNLRKMTEVGVDDDLIRDAILARRGAHRVLPFRFVAAIRHAPRFQVELDEALVANIEAMAPLPGKTVVLVDLSISMGAPLSAKSDMNRRVAAATLAAVVPAEKLRVFSFSDTIKEVPPYRGLAGVEAVLASQLYSMTDLGGAVRYLNGQVEHDRLIVITDEQSQSRVPDPVANKAYMINVASNKNGVGYGKWTHIDGFSESVIHYIQEVEHE